MRGVLALFCAVFLFASSIDFAVANELIDDQIRQILVRDSTAAYPGNCPYPYNTDRAGRRCGKRSAYSRPGGYAPLCYPHDVTEEMVERFRMERATR